MKELKAKPKVTQAMTRDGLTLENQATGEVENISSREAEQDYTPEADGIAEKLLERADDAHDRHKAKKSAKQAAATAAEGDAALHRPSSRLQLTEEERADPDLQPYIRKADKKADKMDAARDAIPKKRVFVKETVYDEATGKAKSALRFEQQDKGPPKLKPNPAGRPVSEALLFAHGKIHEVEHENVGVEGGHKGEELAERQAGRAIRSSIRHHKLKPYRAAEKAERQALAANAEYFYQKSLRDNPEIAQAATNPVSRFWQKQQIKRQYAKAARTAGQTAGTAAQGAAKTAASSTKAAKAAAEESKRAASFVARHWKGSLAVLVLGLLLLMVLAGLCGFLRAAGGDLDTIVRSGDVYLGTKQRGNQVGSLLAGQALGFIILRFACGCGIRLIGLLRVRLHAAGCLGGSFRQRLRGRVGAARKSGNRKDRDAEHHGQNCGQNPGNSSGFILHGHCPPVHGTL